MQVQIVGKIQLSSHDWLRALHIEACIDVLIVYSALILPCCSVLVLLSRVLAKITWLELHATL